MGLKMDKSMSHSWVFLMCACCGDLLYDWAVPIREHFVCAFVFCFFLSCLGSSLLLEAALPWYLEDMWCYHNINSSARVVAAGILLLVPRQDALGLTGGRRTVVP